MKKRYSSTVEQKTVGRSPAFFGNKLKAGPGYSTERIIARHLAMEIFGERMIISWIISGNTVWSSIAQPQEVGTKNCFFFFCDRVPVCLCHDKGWDENYAGRVHQHRNCHMTSGVRLVLTAVAEVCRCWRYVIYRIFFIFYFLKKEEIHFCGWRMDGVRRVAVEGAVSNCIPVIKEGQGCPYGTDRSGLG